MNALAFTAAVALAAVASHHPVPQSDPGVAVTRDDVVLDAPAVTRAPIQVDAPYVPFTNYYWNGGNPVQMMPWRDGFCWLTSIGGNFRGFGESVGVEVWGDNWFLTGQNNYQSSVHGSASCVRYDAFQNRVNGWSFLINPASAWHQAPSSGTIGFAIEQPLWDNNSFCYLGRVSGAFNGGGEFLQIDNDGSKWNLWAFSSARGYNGVSAEARCEYLGQRNPVFMAPANHTFDYEWHQGDPPQQMIPADSGICFLTKMTGRFAGWGEEINARVLGQSTTSAGDWYLYGTSGQVDVAATAHCTYFFQF